MRRCPAGDRAIQRGDGVSQDDGGARIWRGAGSTVSHPRGGVGLSGARSWREAG